MAEERKEKKFQECLECKHEKETGHHHGSGHTCTGKYQPGHEDIDEHIDKKKR
jgi:hypothetical protein